MYYGDDSKFYLEPEPGDDLGGFDVVYCTLNAKVDGLLCVDPGYNPFIILNRTGKYGCDVSAKLDAIIALLEAFHSLTPAERLKNQMLWFENENVYKCLDGDISKPADYLNLKRSNAAITVFCPN